MPDWNLILPVKYFHREAIESIARRNGISPEEFLAREVESIIERDRGWMTVKMPVETAYDLVEDHGTDWEGTNRYDALFETLKHETREREF